LRLLGQAAAESSSAARAIVASFQVRRRDRRAEEIVAEDIEEKGQRRVRKAERSASCDALSRKMPPQPTIWFELGNQLFTIVQCPEDSQALVGWNC
jgi:hypothetical protein